MSRFWDEVGEMTKHKLAQGAAEISRIESPSINPNLTLALDFCREDTGENRQNFIREIVLSGGYACRRPCALAR